MKNIYQNSMSLENHLRHTENVYVGVISNACTIKITS